VLFYRHNDITTYQSPEPAKYAITCLSLRLLDSTGGVHDVSVSRNAAKTCDNSWSASPEMPFKSWTDAFREHHSRSNTPYECDLLICRADLFYKTALVEYVLTTMYRPICWLDGLDRTASSLHVGVILEAHECYEAVGLCISGERSSSIAS